ncbi:MAG: hydroxymethylglutaryl-CoA reductase, degradative [Acholeplasmataceae bacterium]
MKKLKSIHKLSKNERIEVLSKNNLYKKEYDTILDSELFNHLIENYITTYEVPLGVAPNFLIDGKYYHIPMATEEPSVIAGASYAAKIIARNGGFKIDSLNRMGLGQIIFKDIINFNELENFINKNRDNIFKVALKAHPNIASLGGGLKDFYLEKKEYNFATLYCEINTLDAMGANTINTILESIASFIEINYKDNILMSILSNLATKSLVKASVKIDPNTLKNSDRVAKDIHDASLYASIDPYRASTHNKGIMNGISALMLATGNDTRAIEAAAHSYAAISGKYQPLATWEFKNNYLIGEIIIPLQLGTIGGSINILPKAKLSYEILKIKDATSLMKVAASLGLAQNFAALYALTTDGINKGHLKLHARSIALKAGANQDNLNDVVTYLIESKEITVLNAKKYLNK